MESQAIRSKRPDAGVTRASGHSGSNHAPQANDDRGLRLGG